MGPKKGGVSGKARRVHTIETKKEIVELHNKGVRLVDLALKFKVNKSTIGTILKNKEEIGQAKVAKGMTRLYSDAVRKSLIDEVERLLMVWINERQMQAYSTSQELICEKARVIYKGLKADRRAEAGSSSEATRTEEEEFKASRGWFHRFQKRSGIHSVVMHGEAASADKAAAEKYAAEFPKLVKEEGYTPHQLFNCDLSLLGGYCYRRGKGVKKGLSWRCTTKSCCGRMVTDHSISKILAVNPKGHNHVPNPGSMEKKMFKNRLKYIATEEPSLQPEQILENEIIAAPATLSSKELRAVRQSVWRHREQFLKNSAEGKISQAASSPQISSVNQISYDVGRAGQISSEQIRKMTNNGHGKLLEAVKSFIPQLEYGMHKGQAGRVAVIGGCQEYTGAPYFAAITALKVGADLSHVFCTVDAATVIKSYSPELIVHPLLDRSDAVTEISEWLPRFHSLVIGPGLGRDEKLIGVVSEVIEKAKAQKLPLVIDADGIFLVTQDPSIICGYTKAVLTPNIAEFSRLYKKVVGQDPDPETPMLTVQELSRKLGHVTILQKGSHDIITDGENVLICSETGSPRRCGGQGDLLSGSLGVFLYWALQESNRRQDSTLMETYGYSMCAAYASSALTRECNRQAFEDFSRSMTTTDMITKIHSAFEALYT